MPSLNKIFEHFTSPPLYCKPSTFLSQTILIRINLAYGLSLLQKTFQELSTWWVIANSWNLFMTHHPMKSCLLVQWSSSYCLFSQTTIFHIIVISAVPHGSVLSPFGTLLAGASTFMSKMHLATKEHSPHFICGELSPVFPKPIC